MYNQYIEYINTEAELCRDFSRLLQDKKVDKQVRARFNELFKDELTLPLPFHVSMDQYLGQDEVIRSIYSVPDWRKEEFNLMLHNSKGIDREVWQKFKKLYDLKLFNYTMPEYSNTMPAYSSSRQSMSFTDAFTWAAIIWMIILVVFDGK